MNDSKERIYQATPVYAELASEDEQPAVVAAAANDLGAPFFTVSEQYRHIPEACNLTWTDSFFEDDDDDDIVAVFDLDYDKMESFYTSLGWVGIGLSCLYTPLFMLASVSMMPCFLRRNVTWAVRAKHVAITRDGIRVVESRRPCGWGLACMDVGKRSKTVPFEMITDADIVEPAGNECICIPRVLFKVHIDTASSSKEHHELVLAGLKDPHSFKKLVWAMKRAQKPQSQTPNALEMMRDMPEDSKNEREVATLLREIRDELRQNNETLQAMKATTSTSGGAVPVMASAPFEEEARFI